MLQESGGTREAPDPQSEPMEQLTRFNEETQVRFPDRTISVDQSGHFEGTRDEGGIGQLLSNPPHCASGSRTENVTYGSAYE